MAMDLLGIELFAFVFLFIGSTSIGYIFLRTGWPKVRILEKTYKIGWSMVFGAIFSLFSLILSLAFSLFTSLSASQTFLVIIIFSFFLGIIILSLKRKYFLQRKTIISLPKEFVSVQMVQKKLSEKMKNGGIK